MSDGRQILHVTPLMGRLSFGLGQVARNLVREQNALGKNARIWCVRDRTDVHWVSDLSDMAPGTVIGFPSSGPAQLWYSVEMQRAAKGSLGKQVDIAHLHGIWTGCSNVTRLLRKKHGIPYVVAPHGSLQDWSLKKSRLKKAFALVLYERANLREAACLQATAESEVDDFRNFGLRAPIALIRNGVSDSWTNSIGDGDAFRHAHAIPRDRRILFFLSRITPKKGLVMLLSAISELQSAFDDWILVIAGTDEYGHKAEIDAHVERLGLADKIRIIGPLFDQSKRDAFAAAELFVLPSYSEGAPIVILDSLGVGVPVIATQGSPWKDLVTHGCGWWTSISVAGLRDALAEAVAASPDALAGMGQRGRALVASRYNWATLAQRTIDLYDWLLGRGNKPDFVLHD